VSALDDEPEMKFPSAVAYHTRSSSWSTLITATEHMRLIFYPIKSKTTKPGAFLFNRFRKNVLRAALDLKATLPNMTVVVGFFDGDADDEDEDEDEELVVVDFASDVVCINSTLLKSPEGDGDADNDGGGVDDVQL